MAKPFFSIWIATRLREPTRATISSRLPARRLVCLVYLRASNGKRSASNVITLTPILIICSGIITNYRYHADYSLWREEACGNRNRIIFCCENFAIVQPCPVFFPFLFLFSRRSFFFTRFLICEIFIRVCVWKDKLKIEI